MLEKNGLSYSVENKNYGLYDIYWNTICSSTLASTPGKVVDAAQDYKEPIAICKAVVENDIAIDFMQAGLSEDKDPNKHFLATVVEMMWLTKSKVSGA